MEYLIPGTPLHATFLGAAASGYSPIFYGAADGTRPVGSVNAGNAISLDVGGGGINRAFYEALKDVQDTYAYQTRHEALLNQADAGGSRTETYRPDNPTRFSLVHPDRVTTAQPWNDGIVFVDVFGASRQPYGNPKNMAMVYAAPPCDANYADDSAFLVAITQTARHIVEAVRAFNAYAAPTRNGLTALEVLRLCLYSSNIYNQILRVPLDSIALAIFEGLVAELREDSAGLAELQFPVAHGEFEAVRQKLLSSPSQG